MCSYPGWPYAAKPVIQHEFDTDHLNVWLTFDQQMNQNVKPDIDKWHVFVDTIEKTVSAANWEDHYTLVLTVTSISSLPDRVTVTYDGPGPDIYDPSDPAREELETTTQKQWDGWSLILSLDVTT
jgi:hypothetical protein